VFRAARGIPRRPGAVNAAAACKPKKWQPRVDLTPPPMPPLQWNRAGAAGTMGRGAETSAEAPMSNLRLLAAAALAAAANGAEPPLTHVNVFVSGQGGYHAYRIPVIETAPDGTLIAFAEARKHSLSDPGGRGQDIDLVYKRSSDGGATWSAMTVLEDPGELWSAANPATLVDRDTRRVWVFYWRSKPGRGTKSARPGTDDVQTLARWSADAGRAWSDPIDLTAIARDLTEKTAWGASVAGPGGALQTRGGRLVVPFWKYAPFGVFTLFSDDHGATWRRGNLVPGRQGGDESQLVELADGRLLIDMRQETGPHRWLAESTDGGATWSPPRPGVAVAPVACSIERFTLKARGDDRDRIIWTAPKGPDRRRLVVLTSYDEGATFTNERLIADDFAAYSDLTILKDGTAGVLWERGLERGYQFIVFTRLGREFLEPGAK